MKNLGSIVLMVIVLILIIGVNKGCAALQADNCRNSGGQPITRYFDMEYTGCIKD